MTPVLGPIVRPAGSPLALKLSPAVAPAAAEKESDVPSVAEKMGYCSAGASLMTQMRSPESEPPCPSETASEAVKVVGAPEELRKPGTPPIRPVLVLTLSP